MSKRIYISGALVALLALLSFASYVAAISVSPTEQQKLTPLGTGIHNSGGRFFTGTPVAVHGDTAVVGSPYEGPYGSVRVYTRTGGTWSLEAILRGSDSNPGDQFGASVAIDTTTECTPSIPGNYGSSARIVIGAPGHDPLGWNDAGAVYVFERVGGSWSELQKILPWMPSTYPMVLPGGQANFGASVAINKSIIVVGAPGYDQPGLVNQGIAFVFRNMFLYNCGNVSSYSNHWDLHDLLDRTDPSLNSSVGPRPWGFFGSSVAIGDDRWAIAVGEPGDGPGLPWGPDSGTVHVFTRSDALTYANGHFGHRNEISPSDGDPNDRFGTSIGLTGSLSNNAVLGLSLIVGSFRSDGGEVDSGAAYVFQPVTSVLSNGALTIDSWTEEQKLVPSDPIPLGIFGHAVDIDGDTAVIGARFDDDLGTRSGSVYIFSRPGTSIPGAPAWSQDTKLQRILTTGQTGALDEFGAAVAIAGSTAVIGAPTASTHGNTVGRAYMFAKPATTWVEQHSVTYTAGAVEEFGKALAIDGDFAVVGEVRGDGTGAAYVYGRIGTTWSRQQKLPTSAPWGSAFGITVDIDEDTIVVGAPNEDLLLSQLAQAATRPGAVYVYTRQTPGAYGAVWGLEQKIVPSGPGLVNLNRSFGTSVAISGDTLIGGTPSTWAPFGGSLVGGQGGAYVYTRSGGTWTEQALIYSAIPETGGVFGTSVDLDEDTAIIGEPGDSSDTGSVSVYTRSGNTWTLQQTMVPTDAAVGDEFGSAVSLDGDTLIGASDRDSDAGQFSGSAYVFTRTSGTWTQQGKLVASDAAESDWFGSGVAVDGDLALVGAKFDGDDGYRSGSAYVFTRNAGSWSQGAKLTASDAAPNRWFGSAVALDAFTGFVGAPLATSSTYINRYGAAYVFDMGVPGADLALSKGDAPDPVTVNSNLTYDLTVTNLGPGPATNVTLTDTLPASATFQSGTPDQGTCSESGGVVTCDLGAINNGAAVDIEIVVTAPGSASTIVNIASVSGDQVDLVTGNNTADAMTTVSTAPPGAFDCNRSLYIANEGNGGGGATVVRADCNGNITNFASGFNGTSGLQADPFFGTLYISDDVPNIFRVDAAGSVTPVAMNVVLSNPNALDVDSSGRLLVADSGSRILRLTLDGSGLATNVETLASGFVDPQGVVEASNGDVLFTDKDGYVYQISSPSFATIIAPAVSSRLAVGQIANGNEGSLKIDSADNIYTTNFSNEIVRINSARTVARVVVSITNTACPAGQSADNSSRPAFRGIAIDLKNDVFVSGYCLDNIYEFASSALENAYNTNAPISSLPTPFVQNPGGALDNNALDGLNGPFGLAFFSSTATAPGAGTDLLVESVSSEDMLIQSPSLTVMGEAAVQMSATITYTVTVTNTGAGTASGVEMIHTLPRGSSYGSVTPSAGSCATPSGLQVLCALGSIDAGVDATVTVVSTAPSFIGKTANTVSVTSDSVDFNQTNNQDTTFVSVAEVPSVTSATPTTGLTDGGTEVLIEGTGFFPLGTEVRFGGVLAATVLGTSTGDILVTTPTASAGTVDVTVTTPVGENVFLGGFTFAVPPTPTTLAFSTQPSGAVAWSTFTTQPVVVITDSEGNTVASATDSVTMSITSGTGAAGASLFGTATVAAVNGVATFTDLSIKRAGTGYTLTASSGSLTSATSSSFVVAVIPTPIPAMSIWGLIAMALLVSAGMVYLAMRGRLEYR